MATDIKAGSAYVEINAKNNTAAGIAGATAALQKFSVAAKIASASNFIANSGIVRSIGQFGDGMRSLELKMRNFGVSARNLGLDLLKLGIITGTPVAVGVKQFADFEKAIAKVSTFLGENTTQLAQLKSDIMKTSQQYGIGAVEVADGVSEILSAAIPAEQAMTLVNAAIKGSIGNVVQFGEQLHGTIALMQAYRSAGLSATKATELLRVAVDDGIIPAADLAREIGNVASTAALAGVSAEELIASYNTVSQSSISVAEQTTAINNVMLSLVKSAPEAAAAFFKVTEAVTGVGMSMDANTVRAVGFTKIMEILSKASVNDLAEIFPEKRGLKGAILLTQNIDFFKKSLDKASTSSGTAQKAFDKMIATLMHMGEELLTAGKNLAIAFGSTMEDTLKKLAKTVKEVVLTLTEFVKKNPEIIIGMAKIAVIAASVGSALLATALATTILSTTLAGFVAVGSAVFSVIGGILTMIGSLIGFLFSGVGAITVLGVTLLSVFVNFGQVFNNMKQSVKSSFSSIKDTISKFKNDIMVVFQDVKNAIAAKNYDLAVKIVVNKIKMIWFEMVNAVTSKYGEIKDKFLGVLSQLGVFFAPFVNAVSDMFEQIADLPVFKFIGDSFKDLVGDMELSLAGFLKGWETIWGEIQKISLATIANIEKAWIKFKQGLAILVTSDKGEGFDSMNRSEKVRSEAEAKIGENIDQSRAKLKGKEKLDDGMLSKEELQSKKELEKLLEMKKLFTEILALRIEISKETLLGRDTGKIEKKLSNKTEKMIGLSKETSLSEMFDNSFGINKKLPIFSEAQELIEALKPNKARAFAEFLLDSVDQQVKDVDTFKNEQQLKVDTTTRDRKEAIDAAASDAKIRINEEKQRRKEEKDARVDAFKQMQASLSQQAKDEANIQKVKDIFDKLGSQWETFMTGIFPTSTKTPEGEEDLISAKQMEAKILSDGISAAFNTNALGDFSKGDVQKSQLEILKDIKSAELSAKMNQEESLLIQKKTLKAIQDSEQKFK